jgi:hypothetical protein
MSQFFKDKGINFNAEALLSSVKEGATKVADTSSKLFDRARQVSTSSIAKSSVGGLNDLSRLIRSSPIIANSTPVYRGELSRCA